MNDEPFHVTHCVLTDKSDVFEVRCRGIDQRIAASSFEHEAAKLANAFNHECVLFVSRSVENTIDT